MFGSGLQRIADWDIMVRVRMVSDAALLQYSRSRPRGGWLRGCVQGRKRNRVDRVITLFSHPPNPVDLAEPCCPAFVWSSPYMHGARSTVHFLAEPCYIFSPVRASTLARAGLKIFPGARARVLGKKSTNPAEFCMHY